MKKSLAFLLCLIMILSSFAGCSNKNNTNNLDPNVGDVINVYLGEPIYNFDPAEAYKNETSLKINSLLFDNLFVLDEKGKVQKSLVKDYEFNKKTNSMIIELKQNASWSDGKAINANDVVYTWQRILDPSNNFESAALLYDVKNAKAVKNAELNAEGKAVTLDDIGFSALNAYEIEIKFENQNVDVDNFLLKLTSAALCPVREDIVGSTSQPDDWAKSKSTMVSSGPFRLLTVTYEEDLSDPADPKLQQIVLERNTYYFRDFAKDPINESVYPSKIVIKLNKPGESIVNAYNSGALLYVEDIPLAERSAALKSSATVTDALSTNMLVFNQNKLINGYALFAVPEVRQALSLVIDRQRIANEIVFGKPATGIVPNGVFNENSKSDLFREKATTSLSTAPSTNAQQLLTSKGIVPSAFTINISVPGYDEVHIKIAEIVAEAWRTLGFNVNVNKVMPIVNPDDHKALFLNDKLHGTKDDVFVDNLKKGEFEVAIVDYVALSADAFSTLAPFALGYAGTATNKANSPIFAVAPHISGYNNPTYNQLITDASKETDSEKRATLLHEAEKVLLTDLPVVPLIFNENVVLQNDSLDDVTLNYYQNPTLTKAVVKK